MKLCSLFMSLLMLLVLTESCDKGEEILDPCATVSCLNDGVCNDGVCDCPGGFYGESCENEAVQQRLLTETPKALFDQGITLDSLYGKTYEGGYIFSLNTTDGTGRVAALLDSPMKLSWNDAKLYCETLELEGQMDWFLPSQDELNLMWTNLVDSDGDGVSGGLSDPNNFGGFPSVWYWSSTEDDISGDAWFQKFVTGSQEIGFKPNLLHVRAARAF